MFLEPRGTRWSAQSEWHFRTERWCLSCFLHLLNPLLTHSSHMRRIKCFKDSASHVLYFSHVIDIDIPCMCWRVIVLIIHLFSHLFFFPCKPFYLYIFFKHDSVDFTSSFIWFLFDHEFLFLHVIFTCHFCMIHVFTRVILKKKIVIHLFSHLMFHMYFFFIPCASLFIWFIYCHVIFFFLAIQLFSNVILFPWLIFLCDF